MSDASFGYSELTLRDLLNKDPTWTGTNQVVFTDTDPTFSSQQVPVDSCGPLFTEQIYRHDSFFGAFSQDIGETFKDLNTSAHSVRTDREGDLNIKIRAHFDPSQVPAHHPAAVLHKLDFEEGSFPLAEELEEHFRNLQKIEDDSIINHFPSERVHVDVHCEGVRSVLETHCPSVLSDKISLSDPDPDAEKSAPQRHVLFPYPATIGTRLESDDLNSPLRHAIRVPVALELELDLKEWETEAEQT